LTEKIDNSVVDKYANILRVYKLCYESVIARSSNKNTIHIWYEDLIQNQLPAELYNYFNVSYFPPLPNSKMFTKKYQDAFVNWGYFVELVETL
jgi:hypothetical protein